jgi:hypothetical protein
MSQKTKVVDDTGVDKSQTLIANFSHRFSGRNRTEYATRKKQVLWNTVKMYLS